MPPPPPELAPLIERLPQWAQDLITYGIFAGATLAGWWVYLRRLNKPDPPPEQTELVITSAALTNTAVFKELAMVMSDVKTETREVRLQLQELVSLAREEREDRDREREVEARVEAELVKQARKIGRNSNG